MHSQPLLPHSSPTESQQIHTNSSSIPQQIPEDLLITFLRLPTEFIRTPHWLPRSSPLIHHAVPTNSNSQKTPTNSPYFFALIPHEFLRPWPIQCPHIISCCCLASKLNYDSIDYFEYFLTSHILSNYLM